MVKMKDMQYFINVLALWAVVSEGVTNLTLTLSSNSSTWILGQGGVELRCSYQRTTEYVISIAFLNDNGNILAQFFPSNLNINASYQVDGKYLESRTTLTNPGTGSSSAVLTFNSIDCVDEQQYSCKVSTAQNLNGQLSNSVSITVKGNPAAPDTAPSFVPSAGIEEGQNITFTCTGNAGKPHGKFRWIRFRGTQQQIYDSQTTTAVVMPGTCTYNGSSTFTMVMTPEDKGVVIRCQVIYDNTAVDKLYTMTPPIDVYYSVRGVQVSQPTNAPPSYVEGTGPIQLTCSGQGNPVPTSQDYAWYKESSMREPIGTGTTYNIQNVVVNETDYYVCVVQNSFNGKTFNASARTYVKIDFATTPSPTTTPTTRTVSITRRPCNCGIVNIDNSITTTRTSATSSSCVAGKNNEGSGDSSALIGAIVGAFIAIHIVEWIIVYILYRRGLIFKKDKGKVYEDMKDAQTERHLYSTMNQSIGNTELCGEHYMVVL